MYRLLNVNDGHEYAALVHDAYQADGELGIDFAAVTLPEEKLIRGLILNPTYGLFIEGRLVSAITLRMPWVKEPGPYGVPHLGWVSTRPEEKHKETLLPPGRTNPQRRTPHPRRHPRHSR